MTYRLPFLANSLSPSSGLNGVVPCNVFGAQSSSTTSKRPLLTLSIAVGTLMGTMGILTSSMLLSDSRSPAIAHSLPTDATVAAHDHQVSDGMIAGAEAGITIPYSLSFANAADSNTANPNTANPNTTDSQPSPWGEPYTGNGTSTDARGSCPGVNSPLVALMPDVNTGRSLSDYPTLWFYVPYNSETIERGTFLLQDESHNNVITPLAFTLSNTPGFVSVTLPSSVPPLETNRPYHWYFELYCENHNSPVLVDGWIEKTSLDQVAPSPLASPSQEPKTELSPYALYRQNFIWFDALDTIIQEWSEMPSDDLAEELLSLLQSANVAIEEWPTHATPTPVQYD